MNDVSARHRLLAILAADVAGYSRLMVADVGATLTALDDARQAFHEEAEAQGGRIVDTAGDSVLAVFDTAVGAVDAALAIQKRLGDSGAAVVQDRRMQFRIGIHLGDVIERSDGSVYGTGVNIAARLQALAHPGGIWVSDAVRSTLGARRGRSFDDQGVHNVKNIAEAVHVFRLHAGEAAAGVPRRGVVLIAAGAATVALIGAAGWRLAQPWLTQPATASNTALLPLSLLIGPIVSRSGDADVAEVVESLHRDLRLGMAVVHRNYITVLTAAQGATSEANASWIERARSARARFILEGNARWDGERYLATIQIVETESGAPKWTTQIALRKDDAAGHRAQALRDIVGQIGGYIHESEARRVLALPLAQLAPEELVLRADVVYDSKPTLEGMNEALKLTDLALMRNPNFVPALISKSFALLNRYDEEPNPDHDRYARELDSLTARALALDSREPGAWSMRSSALLHLGQWAPAIEAADKVVELDPHAAWAKAIKSNVLIFTGRIAEALQLLDGESVKSSGYSGVLVLRCMGHLLIGHAKEAVDSCETTVGRSPTLWSAHLYLAAAYANVGEMDRARASLRAVEQMSPGHTIARLRAYRYAAHPEYRRRAETYFYAGLRKAEMPER